MNARTLHHRESGRAWREVCPHCHIHRGHRAGCPASRESVPHPASIEAYREFVRSKCRLSGDYGFSVDAGEIHPWLKLHQRASVQWAVRGGRRAIFASFGLGKSVIQLETLRLILGRAGGRALIVAPLGVRQEFKRDAEKIAIDLRFIRRIEEAGPTGIYLTNYETVRDGKLDPQQFTAASLDEASVLRSFGGTKTFREFMRLFEDVPYRFVATATPDPNEYIELLAYAGFLGIMDVSQAKTRFFKRDSTKADHLTLHEHKAHEFWLWVASWALFLNKPSDLGPEYSDQGYDLPPLEVVCHEVPVEHSGAVPDRNGQGRLYRDAMHGVVEAAREKRDTLPQRIAQMQKILSDEPTEHFLLWHDLEAERHAIKRAIPSAVEVYGSQDLDEREQAIIDFSDGKIRYLAAKPVIVGSGCNFQYHCHNAIFCGIGFKFNDFIQACHRIYRFLQDKPVRLHLIYAESEKKILENLLAKWERYKVQQQKMSEIIREYGLSHLALIHVKDRIIPSGITGLGFQTVYPFHADCIRHFSKHGFGYLGMKTIVTDVVRENNQTYRLGWSEQCKDGTKMGVGMPEYLLLFRKPPTDRMNSYADEPVTKAKPFSVNESGEIVPFDRRLPIKTSTGYSRSRWQIDAHGFSRSNGNRLLSPEDLDGLRHEQIFQLFREHSMNDVYDFEEHVRLGEALEAKGILPVTFMLLQPQSWHPDVWSDITRMRTLNTLQYAKGKQQHLCPIPLDLAKRAIVQYSMEGETVLDPFGGLMSVPYCAVQLKRRAIGIELNTAYWADGVEYCRAAEQKRNVPTLFDLSEVESAVETMKESAE